ncbi:MAG: hypothetical protein ABEI96_03105 [Haloarculaceae archaeon]
MSDSNFPFGAFETWQVSWVLVSLALAAGLATTAERVLPGLEIAFLLWFVGFLAGVEILSPRHESPERWSWIRWVLAAGLVVAGAILLRRVAMVL